MAQYSIEYTTWEEDQSRIDVYWSDEVNIWMVAIKTLDEAVMLAKELIEIYMASGDGYKTVFSLNETTFGTYREDRSNGTADGIRAWIKRS